MTLFERLFTWMTKPWVMIAYGVLVILSYCYWDKPLAYYFHSLDLKRQFPILSWFTHLGEGALYITLFFFIALYFRFIRPHKFNEKRTWFLWLCILIPYIVCGVLKVTLGRARPELFFTEHLYGFYGFHLHSEFWSFPSGHTTTIMALAFSLSFLFARYSLAFILAGLAIVLTRIMLNQHYLSDVLATSYLTLVGIGLLVHKSRLQIIEAQTINSGYNVVHH
jgi:hypothetical protein